MIFRVHGVLDRISIGDHGFDVLITSELMLMMSFIARLIATSFYTGFSRIAPGTVGAILALVAYVCLPPVPWLPFLLVLTFLYLVGVWASTIAEQQYGHDAKQINVDEVLGMLTALFALPKIIWLALLAFVLFRFFDIVKPFPIKTAQEKLPRGWGVMTDDLIAGIAANIILQLIGYWGQLA